jgi:hypothetical protein
MARQGCEVKLGGRAFVLPLSTGVLRAVAKAGACPFSIISRAQQPNADQALAALEVGLLAAGETKPVDILDEASLMQAYNAGVLYLMAFVKDAKVENVVSPKAEGQPAP